MTAPISARRTAFGSVELRADPIRDDVIDALALAWTAHGDQLAELLEERGRMLRSLDHDGPGRLPDLGGNLDDILTHAGLGYATTTLDRATARRLATELRQAAGHTPASSSERNAA